VRINDHYKIDLKRSTPWETKLAALAQAEQALAATQGSLPPLPTRLELQNPAADLPALWAGAHHQPQGPQSALRTLIADVTLLPETDPPRRGSESAGTPAPPTTRHHPAPAAPPGRKTQPLPGGRAWTEPVAAPDGPDAPSSPQRLFCHTYGRGRGQEQMIPGWPYSIIACWSPDVRRGPRCRMRRGWARR
jgi:hypothetical protein